MSIQSDRILVYISSTRYKHCSCAIAVQAIQPLLASWYVCDICMSWFENEEFWSFFYEWMFPEESFAQVKVQTEDILTLSGVDKGTILDLCCGPGRYSIPLGKKGFTVTGVDLQPMLLKKALDYSNAENLDIEFIQENMLTFRRENFFGLVISMFSSLKFIITPRLVCYLTNDCHLGPRISTK